MANANEMASLRVHKGYQTYVEALEAEIQKKLHTLSKPEKTFDEYNVLRGQISGLRQALKLPDILAKIATMKENA